MGITQEIKRKANYHLTPDLLNQNFGDFLEMQIKKPCPLDTPGVFFNKLSRGFWCMLQFENHCSKTVNSLVTADLSLLLLNVLQYKHVQNKDLSKINWVPSCRSTFKYPSGSSYSGKRKPPSHNASYVSNALLLVVFFSLPMTLPY